MKITAAGGSDIGLVRKKNQDALGLFPEAGLYIVADGIGGRPAGEVASQMTVDLLRDFFVNAKEPSAKADLASLHDAIFHVNKKVYEASQKNPAYDGMGTTVVALMTDPPQTSHGPQESYSSEVFIGFAGDSRCYLYREENLTQMTQDHSVTNEYIKLGVLTPEAARTHPMKHVISRGVGVASTVQPETFRTAVCAGDLFLLCTDGLSNMVAHEEINALLAQTKSGGLDTAVSALIEGAKKKGGRDNIPVLLVSFEE
jgi:protein phosphatase